MLMCCLSCAKADSCEQADRVEDFCINYEERPQTNADHIRAMSDEELAEFICDQIIDRNIGIPPETWLDWLKVPVEVEEQT